MAVSYTHTHAHSHTHTHAHTYTHTHTPAPHRLPWRHPRATRAPSPAAAAPAIAMQTWPRSRGTEGTTVSATVKANNVLAESIRYSTKLHRMTPNTIYPAQLSLRTWLNWSMRLFAFAFMTSTCSLIISACDSSIRSSLSQRACRGHARSQ